MQTNRLLDLKISTNDCLVLASSFQRYIQFAYQLLISGSMHAIASKVSPIPGSTGIEVFSWDLPHPSSSFYCLQTPTGVKIMISSRRPAESSSLVVSSQPSTVSLAAGLGGMLASGASAALAYAGSPLGSTTTTSTPSADSYAAVEPILRRIYEVYVDFALKNPFYTIDMPIRSEHFDRHLQATLATNRKR